MTQAALTYDPSEFVDVADPDDSPEFREWHAPEVEIIEVKPDSTRVESHQSAQALTDSIREDLAIAAQHFLSAGEKLELFYVREMWKDLSRTSWAEYCELDLNYSPSWCYDLIRLVRLRDQFPQYEPRMLNVGISKMRLLLPKFPQDKETGKYKANPEQVDELLHDAETLTWKDLNEHLKDGQNGYEKEKAEVTRMCPHCHSILTLSRAADILSARRKQE